jgi:anaphase-promoting complex subunit 2
MEEFCKDLPADENSSNLASNSEIDKDWRTWLPDPIDANPVTFTQENSKPDIISMLVNIYGSKDMFVNEYKTLLGDRLLSSYSYTMEKEIRYLELLKLRFGDSNLFCCEAMLRDISESKRINANVLEQLFQKGKLDKSQLTLKCIILSEQFWPKLKDENVELPNEIKQIQEKYTKSFEALKGNRTLIWKNNLGQVTIDIDMGNNRVVEYNVNPIQAAVIMKFQEKDTWTLQELSQSLKMCSIGLRKKLGYWKSQGLIQEEIQTKMSVDGSQETETEIYSLIKDTSKLNRSNSFNDDEDEESNSKALESNNLLKEQDIALLWNYTLSMLRGFGALPFERIQGLLKMYASSDLKQEQVKALLDLKVKEGLIKYNAGVYRLNK